MLRQPHGCGVARYGKQQSMWHGASTRSCMLVGMLSCKIGANSGDTCLAPFGHVRASDALAKCSAQ
eukprot:362078-Chlamydomonas_euryale.AAC.3